MSVSFRPVAVQRSDRKAARISWENSCGCSQAAKWPPRSSSLKWMRLSGYACSAQLRGAWYSSSGKTLMANGMVIGLASKNAAVFSQ